MECDCKVHMWFNITDGKDLECHALRVCECTYGVILSDDCYSSFLRLSFACLSGYVNLPLRDCTSSLTHPPHCLPGFEDEANLKWMDLCVYINCICNSPGMFAFAWEWFMWATQRKINSDLSFHIKLIWPIFQDEARQERGRKRENQPLIPQIIASTTYNPLLDIPI